MTLPISNEIGAERFNTLGRRVENVDIQVSIRPSRGNVYLHVKGEKREQQFVMNRASWDKIAPPTAKDGGARYAVCQEHGGDALYEMGNKPVYLRRIPNDDEMFHCHCGKFADFVLIELSGQYTEHGTGYRFTPRKDDDE
jgi:hypothetical protein